MNRHLVAVKVRVKSVADKRVQFDCLAFYQHRLKRLDTKPVQSRGAVEKNRVFFYNLVKDREHFRRFLLDKHLGFFNIKNNILIDKFFHYEGLK